MKETEDAFWLRFGEPNQSSSFLGDLEGKYLFFSVYQQNLIDIAKKEINENGFEVAKVSVWPNNNDYVLCLYWHDDSRKHELAQRYLGLSDIKYRYWKANSLTRAGVYSKEYK